MKVSIKKLLLIVGIIIIGLMFASVSKATVVDNDYFSIDVKACDYYGENDYENVFEIFFSEENLAFGTYVTVEKDYEGGDGFDSEELQTGSDIYNEMENVELVESSLVKISGSSAMNFKLYYIDSEDPTNNFYCDEYKIQTDNMYITISTFTDYLYQINTNKYAEIISSLKIKDTIALQNDGVPFNDVSNKQWYHAPIKYVYEKGYISGLNAYTYGPNVNLSRCMLVTILWRISGNPAAKGNVSFPDIKTSDWYYTPVIWAAENGIVNGYGNGKFGPNDNISREQLATMLRNYAIFRGKDSSYTASSIDSFQDSKKIADWAVPGVAWAVKNQIIGGKNSGTIVDPQGNATRAEVATMIMKLDTNVLK